MWKSIKEKKQHGIKSKNDKQSANNLLKHHDETGGKCLSVDHLYKYSRIRDGQHPPLIADTRVAATPQPNCTKFILDKSETLY